MSLKRGIVPFISRRTGIPQSTIYNILRGVRRPSWEKVVLLAAATNRAPDFFMGLKDKGTVARLAGLAGLDLIPLAEWRRYQAMQ